MGDTVGKRAGVVSTPDVYSYVLAPEEDAFLVVASDGLWEFMSGADVARALQDTEAQVVARAESGGDRTADAEQSPHLQLALDVLADQAVNLWQQRENCVDDLSVILVSFDSA
jgi:serine/threonine protein phosphatase PrpC